MRRPGIRQPGTKRFATRRRNSAWKFLNQKADAKESVEIKGWRVLWEAQGLRIRLDARKHLYDKRDGKATQPVDHGAGGAIKVELHSDVNWPDPHE
jgi:hypothetical protein